MTDTTTMTDRARGQYQAMSPTGRFAVVVLGITVLLLIWSEFFLPWAGSWGEQADAIEADIARVDNVTQASLSANTALLAYGPVETPDARGESSQALLESIKGIMAQYGITDYKLNESGGGVAVRGLSGRRVERIKADLSFNAPHEDAIELIADLEANPAIESLETLRLSRGKRSGSLDVATTAQAWVYAKGGRR